MDKKDSLLIKSAIKGCVALAEVRALRKTILQTEELKSAFKVNNSIELENLIKDLEATFEDDFLKEASLTLREQGFL